MSNELNLTKITEMRENGDSWRAIDTQLNCKPLGAWSFYRKATQKVKKPTKKLEFTFETIIYLREEERLTWREIGKLIGVKQHKASSYYHSELDKQNSLSIIKILAFAGNEIISKYPPLHLWGIHLLHNDGYSFRELGRYFGDNPSTIQNWYYNHIDALTTSLHPAEADEYDFDLVSIMRAMRWSWKKIASFYNATDAIKTWYNAELSELNGKAFNESIKSSRGNFSRNYDNITPDPDKKINKPPKTPKCRFCDRKIEEGMKYCSENCELFDKKRRQRGKVGNAIVNVLDTVIKNAEVVDRGTKLLMDVAYRKEQQKEVKT